MSKTVVLMLLTLLALSGLVMVGTVFAQSIPKPSVPEFTVELVNSSYDVPTTYSTDPYTGENVTHAGYRVESRTIRISIKNQPFTPYQITENGNTWTVDFFYNIRFKGHFEEDWTEIYHPSDGYPSQYPGQYPMHEYTVFSYQGDYSPTEGMEFEVRSIGTTFPPGAQVDFQVKAMIGYVHREASALSPYVLTGETSDWSNTQTLTIEEFQTPSPEPTPTPSPSPSPSPTETEPPDPDDPDPGGGG